MNTPLTLTIGSTTPRQACETPPFAQMVPGVGLRSSTCPSQSSSSPLHVSSTGPIEPTHVCTPFTNIQVPGLHSPMQLAMLRPGQFPPHGPVSVVSQFVPVNPAWQEHTCEPATSMQFPPFRQGFEAHEL